MDWIMVYFITTFTMAFLHGIIIEYLWRLRFVVHIMRDVVNGAWWSIVNTCGEDHYTVFICGMVSITTGMMCVRLLLKKNFKGQRMEMILVNQVSALPAVLVSASVISRMNPPSVKNLPEIAWYLHDVFISILITEIIVNVTARYLTRKQNALKVLYYIEYATIIIISIIAPCLLNSHLSVYFTIIILETVITLSVGSRFTCTLESECSSDEVDSRVKCALTSAG